MEIFILILAVVVAGFLLSRTGKSRSDHPALRAPKGSQKPETASGSFEAKTASVSLPGNSVTGTAYVVDGDTIKIQKTQIRLYGIDAPELNHPYGQKAKWALVSLCKGQSVRADIQQTDDYGRTVAKCYLPDGRDLSAEMTKLGLAIDWPKFSGGKYRLFEQPGVRKKLWLADARQKGRMHVWENYEARQKSQTN